MGRSRSRSRSRDRARRSRSRSRSRDRERSPRRERKRRGWDDPAPSSTEPSDAMAAMQAIAFQQQQQQHYAQLLAQQSQAAMAMQQQQQQAALAAIAPPALAPAANEMALDAPPSQANKKQRELYIGNLAVGQVTTEMLRELFNSLLGHMVPDPVTTPPVMEVKPDPTGRGRFAFVELRTAALAVAALLLDKMELCGRQLNIGRPKGYVEPPSLEQQAKLNAAQMFAAQVSGGPTNVVLLEGLVPAATMRVEEERRELYDDVYLEAVKCGQVAGLALPAPPLSVPETETCRVYVRFATQEGAAKCKAVMDGRDFDDNKVKASYVTEQDFYRAHQVTIQKMSATQWGWSFLGLVIGLGIIQTTKEKLGHENATPHEKGMYSAVAGFVLILIWQLLQNFVWGVGATEASKEEGAPAEEPTEAARTAKPASRRMRHA